MKFYQTLLVLSLVFANFFSSPAIAFKPRNWLCVYHKIPLEQLKKANVDLMVLDPDCYSAFEIQELKLSGATVVAYLSVGEAESYRDYYAKIASSGLIIAENESWKTNFSIKYWDPLWLDTLQKYSSSILEKGFDGFFMDVVDAWEAYDEEQQPEFRKKMQLLLTSLADFSRRKRAGIKLILQNSHQLMEAEEVFRRFDGINQESLFASWANEKIDKDWQQQKIVALEKIRKKGKFVTLLEYTRNPLLMAIANMKASLHGFIPYFSVKDLDQIFLK